MHSCLPFDRSEIGQDKKEFLNYLIINCKNFIRQKNLNLILTVENVAWNNRFSFLRPSARDVSNAS